TLEEQDRVLGAVRKHLKPGGRFWVDIFQPDIALIADPKLENLEPSAFFVPRYRRTVAKTTTIRRIGPQVERVTFHYSWFDEMGRKRSGTTEFDLTFMFDRELRILLERNGRKIEKMWGNYDGSELKTSSPRIIARCCRG